MIVGIATLASLRLQWLSVIQVHLFEQIVYESECRIDSKLQWFCQPFRLLDNLILPKRLARPVWYNLNDT